MVKKIVSGGQTGVDRAGLDVGLELGLHVGGWCPRGRKAEDGKIPEKYPLKETPSADYPERTEWNIRDSGGTLVFTRGKPSRGTALTIRLAEKLRKPCLVVDLTKPRDPERVRQWLRSKEILVLNVAGPRGSKNPSIGQEVVAFLREVLQPGATP